MLKSIPLPVPPLAKQERMVKLLDEADELRQLRTQADGRTAALIPALFHKMFGDEAAESGKPLGEVCSKITDGVHITPTYVDEGVPFLRVTDIQEDQIDWNSVKRIPESEYDQITRRTKPEQHDILYSKNGTIGIAKEITWERPFAHFVSLALLKPKRDILNPTFLTSYLNTPDALRQAVGHTKTGTVSNLHLNEIRKMRVPCPDMETQQSFVKWVEEIRELATRQAASRKRSDDLFQSMLHRAFNGEL
jgi:type I restriction enzyme S subunit